MTRAGSWFAQPRFCPQFCARDALLTGRYEMRDTPNIVRSSRPVEQLGLGASSSDIDKHHRLIRRLVEKSIRTSATLVGV